MRVIVIGAGLLGTTTAWFLSQHGFEVTVIERREAAGLETSWGNGGYSQSGFPEHWNIPGIEKMIWSAWRATWGEPPLDAAMLVRTKALPGLMRWGLSFLKHSTLERYHQKLLINQKLARFSQTTLSSLIDELDIECAMKNRGGLWIFRDQQGLDHYASLIDSVPDLDTESSVLSGKTIAEIEPSLAAISQDLVGGISFNGELSADPHRFCAGLAAAAEKSGVVFHYGQKVQQLEIKDDEVHVQTTHEEHRAEKLVIAAGVQSPHLALMLGIKLLIKPAKGYSLSVPMEAWEQSPSHVIGDMSLHAGTTNMDPFLRVAGTAEFTGNDLSISQNRIESLFYLLEQIFPELAEMTERKDCQAWAGLRPLSSDGLPFVGDSGREHVYLNTGHGGLGWTQCAGSGRALADHIAGKKPELDLSNFMIR